MGLTLLSLPPEVLEKVTEGLAQSLIRLWRTGNKLLMWKLSKGGGLREVALCDTAQGGISRYPIFLGDCVRIEKITIDVGGSRLCSPEMLWQHLSKLVALKYLSLSCYEAEEWLLNVEDEVNDFGVFLEDSLVPSQPLKPIARLRPFAETFLKLETLVLNTPKSEIRDEDLAAFPVSLTSLDVVSSMLLTWDCLRYFRGSNMKVFKSGWSMEMSELGLSQLPPTLTTLHRGTWRGLVLSKPVEPLRALLSLTAAVDAASLAWLPATLTYFKWHLDDPPNFALLSPLPFPHLKHLIIYTYREVYANLGFPTFPPTLETLELDFKLIFDGSLPTPIMTFPAGLHTLLIKLARGFTVEKLRATQLPPSLTKLSIYHDREQIDGRLLSFLPRQLTTLIVTELPYGSVPTPKKLTTSLSDSLAAHPLPSSLTTLTLLYMGEIDPSQFACLPRALTLLACCLSKEPSRDHCLALPPNLTTLALTLPDLGSCPLGQSTLEGLPRNITDLTFTGPSLTRNATWDDATLAALPPALLSLSLEGKHLQDESVRLLPTSLTHFSFRGADAPTSRAFAFLPRELRTLKLETATQLVDADVPLLPKLLKRLHLSPSPQLLLTHAALPFLPPSLSVFLAKPSLIKAFSASIKAQRNLPFTRCDPRTFTNSPSLHNQKY